MSISVDCFGEIKQNDGFKKVTRFTIANESMVLQVINYGATITSLKVPDKLKKVDDIVMGFDNISDYVNHPFYFGSTVGRFANRIANGEFILESTKYSLAKNNGPHHLHGGINGFDKVVWDAAIRNNTIIFSYISPSMEENYPGNLNCNVTYELTKENEMLIHYEATTTHITPINITNHSYFNLAGHGSGNIQDHIISLNADSYIPVDETSIPTGTINPVTATHFDLREPKNFGNLFELIPSGFDHTFCINGASGIEKKVASVYHPKSGRFMEVNSTQPGVQLYTANFLPEDNSLCGKEGKYYNKQGALCIETQNYPDAINQFKESAGAAGFKKAIFYWVNFPRAFLNVGEVYNHTTRFSFSIK